MAPIHACVRRGGFFGLSAGLQQLDFSCSSRFLSSRRLLYTCTGHTTMTHAHQWLLLFCVPFMSSLLSAVHYHRGLTAHVALSALLVGGGAQALDGGGSATENISIFVSLFIGGIALGAIIILPIVCLRWQGRPLELHPRERCMWETAPSSSMSTAKFMLINKIQAETLGTTKKVLRTDVL
ncbi:hypothetical protein, unknown function [Leishmania tarentolae]|uniref:Uncharacterized protein n=1 Tax=Leishmania tarentolae TaxID=5689 RepID=A0A640KDN9_LEITA|nr:hypothetical protein, unknown function [Leishmania tarentolae]